MVEINRFDIVRGNQILEIYNQSRYGYSLSEGIELNEIEDVIQHSGKYDGMTISFYDFDTGQVNCPFDLKQNVGYGQVTFIDGYCYFLQCDYAARKVNVIEYLPGQPARTYVSLNMDEVELGNLMIMENGVNVVSNTDVFESYYPQKFRMKLVSPESVVLIDEDKVYINQWVEEGWDEELDIQTNDFKYYDQLIIRDFEGNLISKETAKLSTHHGQEWLS
ncbi:hypothetical protein ACMGE5_05165 [Macrococcus equi]|uniref:hypothetical protein n=1 Tax=Macrococcus equi TaxID=3395462 RepID=UPI0039BE48F8